MLVKLLISIQKWQKEKAMPHFFSRLFLWHSTVKGNITRPNNVQLSETVFLLKSNIHQRCFFTAAVHYTSTGAGKHHNCKESSKSIFANSIIRFNAPINYCFCCLCCLIWLTFNSHCIIICLPPRIALSSVLSWLSRQKTIALKFCFKYLFYLLH